jgi:hypothetical protein
MSVFTAFRTVLTVAVAPFFLSACVTGVAPGPTSPGPTLAPTLQSIAPEQVPPTTITPPSPPSASQPPSPPSASQPLLPDPAADYTVGDTARLSGGEFVGDQADLTVIEAVRLEATGDQAQYAFLVEITGLDPDTFPYNLRDFRLIDDQDFQYEPLFDGGEQPRLEFGDLSPEQTVRGWLTFDGPAVSTTIRLQYAPALALDPAVFGFLVP